MLIAVCVAASPKVRFVHRQSALCGHHRLASKPGLAPFPPQRPKSKCFRISIFTYRKFGPIDGLFLVTQQCGCGERSCGIFVVVLYPFVSHQLGDVRPLVWVSDQTVPYQIFCWNLINQINSMLKLTCFGNPIPFGTREIILTRPNALLHPRGDWQTMWGEERL